MKTPDPPRGRDRMPGRYWTFWWLSPGRQKSAGRWRRRVDDRILRRYAGTVEKEEAAAIDADNDPSDCVHGCNGDCVVSGSDKCSFFCHPHLRKCPRCGRVAQRHEFHDHENEVCEGYWGCTRCAFMEPFRIVGCPGD